MRRPSKEPSRLKYFLFFSLVIHLAVAYFLPDNLITVSTKGLIETDGILYNVDFVQLEKEVIKDDTPADKKEDEKEVIKEEKEEEEEKKPVQITPIEEPKPDESSQGVEGTEEDPNKAIANLDQPEPEPEP
ncbi:MAG: hypothetical protein KAX49_17530, partial [Halanaerobiales bacterium]|nr:hypothetical protein [Halanaerobiales bacterium]